MKKSKLFLFSTLMLFLFSGSMVSAQQLDHVLDEALVQLKDGTDLDQFKEDISVYKGVNTKARILRKVSRQLNVYKIGFDNEAVNEYEFREHIYRQNNVLIVQVNHLLTKRQTIPDDPEFDTQWHWVNPNDADIDMDLAWDITTGGLTANGDEIVVAVFDDGGDLDHPDLIANNWVNVYEIANNGIDDDNNGYVDDVNGWNFGGNNNNVDGGGHGVNVAGMIGAVGNNANQGCGVNWNVKIMNIRYGGIAEDQVIEFYSYALDQRERYNNSGGTEGSFVVATNSSWGIDGGNPDNAPLWCGFYDTMGAEGILSCGATANNNVNIDVVGDLPTACPSEFMVAVTATNDQDNRTFSGYGATTIDVGAPGEDIYTTSQGGGYTFTSGTSFASPTTAGVIGLLYSAPCSNLATLAMSDPQAAAEQVRDALFEGSENVGNLDGDVVYGRINAFNSLNLIMENCGPCPAPSGINVSDVIDVSVNLTWANPSDAQTNNLRYRETGALTWTEVVDATSPYALTDLIACTEYEVQVEAACTDTMSGYSNSFVFITEGCCVAPDDLMLSDINNNGVTSSWTAIFAAESYNLRWREIGAAMWTEMNLTDTEFTIANLMECTDYEVQVQTVCANATTDFSESVVFTTFGCGACTDLTYCESGGEDSTEEWIVEFVLGDINNQTPDEPASGYSDFTGTANTTTLVTFNTYDVTMTPGYEGQNYNEYFRVYIDYNQDGTFDEATEVAYDAIDLTQESITGQINVPGTALEGLTRLRVVMRFNNPGDPCGGYNFGETEDYCITIEAGEASCDMPEDLTTSAISETAATFSWSDIFLADSYSVDYKATGATTWSNVIATTNTVTVTDLVDCTDYEWRVESLCPNNETSGFTSEVAFTTICACAVPTSLDTANVTMSSADLSWVAAANANNYDVRYKIQTATTWITENATTTSLSISSLELCSDYEYQVRTVCANSQSEWSPSFDFNTACLSAVSEVENGLEELAMFPNPFSEQVTSKFNLTENTFLTLEVYSATGQRLTQNTYDLGAGTHTLVIPGLEKANQGLYFVSMTTEKGTKVRRVVKQ